MSWYKCLKKSGVTLEISDTEYMTPAEYAQATKQNDHLYVVRHNGWANKGIYLGNDQVSPALSNYNIDDYDFFLQKQRFNSQGVNTGIAPFSSENIGKDWEIQFQIANVTSTYRGVFIGSAGDSNPVMNLMVTNTDIQLYLTGVGSANLDIVDSLKTGVYKVVKENMTLKFYDPSDTLLKTYNLSNNPGSNNIMLGNWNNSNYFAGDIELFTFKFTT